MSAPVEVWVYELGGLPYIASCGTQRKTDVRQARSERRRDATVEAACVCYLVALNDIDCIVRAANARAAKMVAVLAYREANGMKRWPKLSVRRAGEYDLIEAIRPRRCYSPEFLEPLS